MSSVLDAMKWHNWYSDTGLFGEDQQGIVLAVNIDEVNHFGMANQYSSWPIMLNTVETR